MFSCTELVDLQEIVKFMDRSPPLKCPRLVMKEILLSSHPDKSNSIYGRSDKISLTRALQLKSATTVFLFRLNCNSAREFAHLGAKALRLYGILNESVTESYKEESVKAKEREYRNRIVSATMLILSGILRRSLCVFALFRRGHISKCSRSASPRKKNCKY